MNLLGHTSWLKMNQTGAESKQTNSKEPIQVQGRLHRDKPRHKNNLLKRQTAGHTTTHTTPKHANKYTEERN
jgi:hypothetical protein